MQNDKPIIFISCGQATQEERELGSRIQELVHEITGFEPYFAEYQSSLEGLTKNIFSALYNCVGFITVMHNRGTVDPPGDHVRASVWVEQEIAIASFIREMLGKQLNVAALSQEGVGLEGIRKQLLLNPKEFKSNEEALEHLRLVLPGWEALDSNAEPIGLSLKYETTKATQERHDYKLICIVTNRGDERVEEYYVDVEFPHIALLNKEYPNIINGRCSESHSFFRDPLHGSMPPLYPGDSIRLLNLDYFIDNSNYGKIEPMLPVRATFYAKGGTKIYTEVKLSELQRY